MPRWELLRGAPDRLCGGGVVGLCLYTPANGLQNKPCNSAVLLILPTLKLNVSPELELRPTNVKPPDKMAASQLEDTQMDQATNEKTSKRRHRASIACVACRERRTRCVVQSGENSCTQCMDTGQECIIKNDDQRRK